MCHALSLRLLANLRTKQKNNCIGLEILRIINKMEEYLKESKLNVQVKKLRNSTIPNKEYQLMHQGTVIACHDVFIAYDGGILLVTRKNNPAKNETWPVGGRILRGVNTEVSLKRKALAECGLRLEKIKEIGVARTFFNTDPFSHGKGTDTISIVYFAYGKGKIKLDSHHQKPIILRKSTYLKNLKNLHPYVGKYVKECMRFL